MTYIIVLDTETTNTIVDDKGQLDSKNSLVYDIGWAIIDLTGNVYKTASYINADIFCGEKEMMKTSYYADKIPNYWRDYRSGSRKFAKFETIRTKLLEDMVEYGIQTVCCHNAQFDINALNATRRYLSKSAMRTFFPKNVAIWDSMKMAQDTICKMKSYKKFCKDNGYVTSLGVPRKSAEVLYKFIINDITFEESHTALEDVLIEKEIVAYCFAKHMPMRKRLYKKTTIIDPLDMTDGTEIVIESEEVIDV